MYSTDTGTVRIQAKAQEKTRTRDNNCDWPNTEAMHCMTLA